MVKEVVFGVISVFVQIVALASWWRVQHAKHHLTCRTVTIRTKTEIAPRVHDLLMGSAGASHRSRAA
jgi:hypothetical protein